VKVQGVDARPACQQIAVQILGANRDMITHGIDLCNWYDLSPQAAHKNKYPQIVAFLRVSLWII
jgi:hypothetical protein